ncbi:hypothetical protein [Sphingobium quisquiliarum]|uniref:hypothetical protein n=1 Tax=Sphingobium quisquiliarum TaxID=538379 RepID=UPI00126919FD|nr:hypothetical protein [Sphingobium quisquiliarum]
MDDMWQRSRPDHHLLLNRTIVQRQFGYCRAFSRLGGHGLAYAINVIHVLKQESAQRIADPGNAPIKAGEDQ